MASVPDLGIPDDQRRAIAHGLSRLLADTYTLYLKTHNYHWNVTGPHFGALHAMFETQYTDLALAVDALAERIRALGHRAPGSYAEFSMRTDVVEATTEPTKAMEMVAALTTDHQMVARTAARVISVANAGGDEPTAGLATTRQEVHEKNAWMLRSFLE